MPTEVDRYLSGVPIGMLQPNVILPSRHFGDRKPLAPERRLMIAVVQDAINCIVKYRFATDRRGRRLFNEGTQWLGSKDTGWPYSFESICEAFSLDANAVRHRLGVVQEQQPVLVRRRAESVRKWCTTVNRPRHMPHEVARPPSRRIQQEGSI